MAKDRNVTGTVVVVLVRQTFFKSLDLDLEVEANLLLLVKFGREVIEAPLVRASEVFEIAAKLLQLRMNVAGVFSMRCYVYSLPNVHIRSSFTRPSHLNFFGVEQGPLPKTIKPLEIIGIRSTTTHTRLCTDYKGIFLRHLGNFAPAPQKTEEYGSANRGYPGVLKTGKVNRKIEMQ